MRSPVGYENGAGRRRGVQCVRGATEHQLPDCAKYHHQIVLQAAKSGEGTLYQENTESSSSLLPG